jgi:hypothetical protein
MASTNRQYEEVQEAVSPAGLTGISAWPACDVILPSIKQGHHPLVLNREIPPAQDKSWVRMRVLQQSEKPAVLTVFAGARPRPR